jgi:carbon monoxide dehydrogenase subunit G
VYQDIARTVAVSAPPDAVWEALLDFRRVASWLSIVGEIREVEPLARYGAVLEDRVGPFRLRADLTVTVSVDRDTRTLHVAASGEDRQVASRIAATLDVAARADGDATALAVSGRYEITGRIATLGAPAIRAKGEKVLDEFFTRAARALGAT